MIQPITVLFLIASSVLATVHYLALQFFLYWRFWWFDLPVHLLGGAVVALGFITLSVYMQALPRRYFSLAGVILFVILVALLWEYYEIAIGIPIEANHELDTSLDLLLGVLGGLLGYVVGTSINSLKEASDS